MRKETYEKLVKVIRKLPKLEYEKLTDIGVYDYENYFRITLDFSRNYNEGTKLRVFYAPFSIFKKFTFSIRVLNLHTLSLSFEILPRPYA